ncbi:ABC transporter ATP-binding protein [Paenibacillus sacheonensis]|uniref:ATP-binding cassette domain-containing protein n=1 Tax=Paenibacillus sacheonensis TaxID=742054 RepID=A0A7X4YQW6_9BACL|nr:ABC transporter ATP-binding protein [Paenibacillus sacheonensis]MBM7565305.1 ABC-2 type transport system ATP-binding protein [Paenibacillus sacheonensis]NBC69924.1 ATP-binding cassette domain-containing protein [Paenibacillus sacheonensis]
MSIAPKQAKPADARTSTEPQEAFVRFRGVSKSFGALQSLRQIDLALYEGRCAALLGPNGAGKTTLIRIVTGLLAPTSGSVRFQGLAPGADPRALIGYLPQHPAFYGWMSGSEFVRYAGRLCGLSKREAAARGTELLERVGLGAAAGKRRIGGYSGGMKQRLGLAQALMHRPKLLVLDEPVSALDPVGRRDVMDLLRELKQETTILFSTHVLHDAEELCDDVILLQEGGISISGAIGDIRGLHRTPALTLEVEDNRPARMQLGEWLSGLSHPSIASAALLPGEYAVKLQVRDADEARIYVLRQVLERGLPLAKLEIGHASLEDIFLKAVDAP